VASIFITTLVTAGLEKFMKKPLAVALSVALANRCVGGGQRGAV
jgi:hypothetical protein